MWMSTTEFISIHLRISVLDAIGGEVVVAAVVGIVAIDDTRSVVVSVPGDAADDEESVVVDGSA